MIGAYLVDTSLASGDCTFCFAQLAKIRVSESLDSDAVDSSAQPAHYVFIDRSTARCVFSMRRSPANTRDLRIVSRAAIAGARTKSIDYWT